MIQLFLLLIAIQCRIPGCRALDTRCDVPQGANRLHLFRFIKAACSAPLSISLAPPVSLFFLLWPKDNAFCSLLLTVASIFPSFLCPLLLSSSCPLPIYITTATGLAPSPIFSPSSILRTSARLPVTIPTTPNTLIHSAGQTFFFTAYHNSSNVCSCHHLFTSLCCPIFCQRRPTYTPSESQSPTTTTTTPRSQEASKIIPDT